MEQRVKIRLAVLGVTATALAQAAGIAGSSLHEIITGKVDSRASTLAKVEDALGVPRGWLSLEADTLELARQAATFAVPTWVTELRT